MSETHLIDEQRPGTPRERVLDTAYELFSRRGIRAVGIDEVIDRAGVAKATLYRHFPCKDDLVLAFLERREERWTRGLVEAEARKRGATPEEQLLAVFDVFDEWFRGQDFDTCAFINVLSNIRSIVRELADEAGLHDTEALARSWHILMKGSIISAAEGDLDAAQRAKAMARDLLERH